MSYHFRPLDEGSAIAKLLTREKEVEQRARELLDQHGLHDWKFRIARTKTFMGTCYYSDKVIEFSSYFLHESWEQIDDTILHEIAHALVGPKVKAHGWVWKSKAMEIGANPNRVAENAITAAQPNYRITCGGCGRSWTRHRLKAGYTNGRFHCSRCKSKNFHITYIGA